MGNEACQGGGADDTFGIAVGRGGRGGGKGGHPLSPLGWVNFFCLNFEIPHALLDSDTAWVTGPNAKFPQKKGF